MAFPREIRNMIYDLLLLADAPIPIDSPRGAGRHPKRLGEYFASLIAVCREIGAEAKMKSENAKDLEGFSCSILKYFKGIGKIVVVNTGAFDGYKVLEQVPLTTGPVKAMTKLLELPKLEKICFLDEKRATSSQGVVDKMLEGKSGEPAREKNIVAKVAEEVLEEVLEDYYYEYRHWMWDME
ncbi:hypothetical protein DL98DRAFT_514755 [Cadophora sp. DSE1049]|nr:hypothetical protein DL98DRAFT_514755 [Cadophora sp. DSE1049]